MGRPIRTLPLDEQQRLELRDLEARPKTPQRLALRARIILHRGEGHSQQETARLTGVRRTVVAHWEKRFRQQGLAGLAEARRPGRKPRLSPQLRGQIITGATRPPKGRRRWSTRTMAKATGVSNFTVQKLWSANGIKPHLTRTFKLSKDPRLEAKFWDVIGLYLHPPDRALVLCCDEKSQCQALERTQPGLPLGVGHVRTKTHDYIRHGTVTLFAALNYLDGRIFRQIAPRHTHQEWLSFLRQINRQAPTGLTLHLIVDNYATHKHPKVKNWIERLNAAHLQRHGVPRLEQHFTPTSSSWLNLVERFFRDLTEDSIREGSFASVKELIQNIEAYLAERDLNPKRYVWKADGHAILEKIQRAKAALNSQVIA